jgi:type VI secretion system secreted protein Hcp
MKKDQIYRSLLLAILLLATTLIASAQSVIAYMTIDGAKAGKFKGGALTKGNEGKIECIGFNYSVSSPHDMATGMATGKRMQQPVRIIKTFDSSTPQLLTALYTNEVLKTVVIEFYKRSQTGMEVPFYTITLTNATISAIAQNGGTAPEKVGTSNIPNEEISFVFQKIEVNYKDGNVSAADDWISVR